jgi:acetate kinase
MTDAILTLNAGSSSIKFTLFASGGELTRSDALCDGEVEGLGDVAHLKVRDANDKTLEDRELSGAFTHDNALKSLLACLDSACSGHRLVAAGHRLVHGGLAFTTPVLITSEVIGGLKRLVPLAPLHQPHNIAAIEAVARLHPGLPQVACFDTAFHHGQPAVATAFALPRALGEEGVRRYGFHGLSYEYIAGRLPHVLGPDIAEGRVVVAHLGAGASLCAMHRRRSVATTMSFTALDGLMMARRCGAIDPGVILYLLEQKGMSVAEVTNLLYSQSGLLGVSGISDDMRELLASADLGAKEAVDLFVYRITRGLGSMAAALGGLDALVFTAGIGENAPEIRRRICEQAAWLGIMLDDVANARNDTCISQSRVSAWVIPTDEDLVIAQHTRDLIGDMGAAGAK